MEKEEGKKSDAEAKEKKAEANGKDKAEQSLEQLILDTSFNKYDAVLLARRWAYELKDKEGETRSLQDLIAVAIKDILGTRVSHKMVRELPQLKTKKQKGAQLLETLQKIQPEKEAEKENGKAKSKK